MRNALIRLSLTSILACVAMASMDAPSAQPYERNLPRPQIAGIHDDILVPISLSDCGFSYRHEPAVVTMQTAPAEEWWLQSNIRLALEIVPVGPDIGCLFWEPGKEPVLAARAGRLSPGTHRFDVEVRRFAAGSDVPYSTEVQTHHAVVLEHQRFESGFWYEPARPGHGLSLIARSGQAREEYDQNGDSTGAHLSQSLYLSWQTYDADGQQMWLTGAASDAALQPLVVEVFHHDGMHYPALDPAGLQTRRWGTATMEPDGCGRLRVVWRPDAPSLSARVTLFERLVGTEELSYCDPHPTWWTILPVQQGDGGS
jgi:hypothetical protein